MLRFSSDLSTQEEKPPKKELKPCAKRHWELSAEPKTIKKAIKKSKKRSRTQKEAKGKGRRPESAYGDGHANAHEHGNGGAHDVENGSHCSDEDSFVDTTCEEGICDEPDRCDSDCGCPCHH